MATPDDVVCVGRADRMLYLLVNDVFTDDDRSALFGVERSSCWRTTRHRRLVTCLLLDIVTTVNAIITSQCIGQSTNEWNETPRGFSVRRKVVDEFSTAIVHDKGGIYGFH